MPQMSKGGKYILIRNYGDTKIERSQLWKRPLHSK